MISIKRGASKEYIDNFHLIFGDDLDFIRSVVLMANEVFEIYEDGNFLGGVCVFDVSIKNGFSIKSGAYIYGAYIIESARGRGLFRQLCDHVCEFYANEFYDFALTIPAKSDLFHVYERLGFDVPICGVISLTGEYTGIILPQGTSFRDFDGDFQALYFMHIQNDMLIKTFDLFKLSLDGFDIKYIEYNESLGYALFKGDALVYASGAFVTCSPKKKGLIRAFSELCIPQNLLCDILFEI